MQILDCTLRDGANVLGKGFPKDITEMILSGLIENGIDIIEFGNAGGIGAYDVAGMIAPLTDNEYIELAQPFIDKAEIGMFLNAKRYREKYVDMASDGNMKFIRVGAEPGMADISKAPIEKIKKSGMKVRYAMMKAYLEPPEKLAREAKVLQSYGLDEITIMDSAGMMLPAEAKAYASALSTALEIPVGFHGHNNLGLSAANALAAYEGGAQVMDCGLMGMARSAGNLATENAVLIFKKLGKLPAVDSFGLLDFIDNKLAPKMSEHDYRAAISPLDLILGYTGTHSSFLKLFKKVSEENKVPLYRLIEAVSATNIRNPTEKEILEAAKLI